METLGWDLYDVADALENGYDCFDGPRKAGIFERCLRKDGMEIKIVGRFVEDHPYAEGPAWTFWHAKPTGRQQG